MADYKVGNLQIIFDAVDETSKSFDNLARNLKSVQKAIAKIGDTDLKPFVANIKQITKSFTPLLTNISGASEGIIALNQAIQKVGVKNLTRATQQFDNLRQEAEETTNSIKDLEAKISGLNNNVLLLGLGSSLKEMRGGTAGYNWVGDYALQVQGAIKYSDEFRESIIRLAEQMILSRKVYDESSASMNRLANQWKNLYANVIQYGNQYGEGFVGKANEELAKLQQQYFQMRTVVDDTNNAFREMEEIYKRSRMSAEELTIAEYREVEAKRRQRIEFLQASLALGEAGKNTNAYKKELAKLTNEQEKNNKTTKKSTSGFGKLFASIKRIALYRLIRTALKNIASSITETAKAFAQVDDGVNDTMSQLTSSLSIIKLSFGATLLPLLEMITPIVQEIGIAFANVANMVSQAMSTTGTYTKINTDYIKNYRDELEKTGSLLDFDKFRALSGGKGGLTDFLIPNQEVDENNEKVSRLSETLSHIKNIILEVWEVIKQGWQVAQPFVESALEIIEKTVKKINELGLTKPLIYGIIIALTALGASKIITGIKNLTGAFNAWGIAIASVALGIAVLASWDEFNAQTKRTITIVAALVGVFTSLAIAIMAAQGALTLGTGIPLILAAAMASAVTIRGLVDKDIYTYANGGVPRSGTLFYAGEAGAETVTVGSSGRTEVTNVSQMEQALYNALVRFSNQNRGTDGGAININIDGQKVFEATRRTANKRGLDFSRI